jgi:drug/metabolite transporter (DMT)-like permease
MSVQSVRSSRNAALAGIGLMLLSVFAFTVNNALGKWTITSLPVGEFLFLRSAVALILLCPFYWSGGLDAFRNAPRITLQFVRIALSASEITLFYWTVSYLPLADAMTFWLATPIYVTALSAILLGEKVGWRRWTAVIIGFIGVVLAMRPSSASFTGPALLGVVGAILYAGVLLATRSLRNTPNPILIGGPLFGSMLLGAATLPFAWVTPSPGESAIFVVIALVFIAGAFCTNRSLRLAPASVVVPYQYTMIIWGVIFGYVFFGEAPQALTLIGAAIITAAGIYIFMREQAVAKENCSE